MKKNKKKKREKRKKKKKKKKVVSIIEEVIPLDWIEHQSASDENGHEVEHSTPETCMHACMGGWVGGVGGVAQD